MSDWSTGIEAAAKVWGEEWGFEWEEEDQRMMASIVRAFLDAQPSIRWCRHHDSPECVHDPEDEIPHCIDYDAPPYQSCRIVSLKLVDPQ